MVAALLAFPALLSLQDQESSDAAERLAAVQRVLALVRDVERICRPSLLTDPPTPITMIPAVPARPSWATEDNKVWFVSYGDLRGYSTSAETSFHPRIPLEPGRFDFSQGVRLRSDEACLRIGRALAEMVKPERYALGESFVSGSGWTGVGITTNFVLPQDRRIHVGRNDVGIDRGTGYPDSFSRPEPKPLGLEVAPERLAGILPLERLEAAALELHGRLGMMTSTQKRSGRYEGHLIYRIPAFEKSLNEMNDEDRGHVRRGEGVPLYELTVQSDENGTFRKLWIDARTGRAIAASTFRFVESSLRPVPIAPVTEGRWRINGVWGRLRAAPAMDIPAIMWSGVVSTNDKREVRVLLFDPKSEIVLSRGKLYRADPALVGAMHRVGPSPEFGFGTSDEIGERYRG